MRLQYKTTTKYLFFSLPFYLRLRVVPDAVQVLPNVMVLPDALALEAGQYTVPSS